MSTPFTAFLPEVLPYVHDCPQIAAINAIRNAAVEFCEKSHYWQMDIAAFDADKGTSGYIIAVPAETVLIDVIEGWYDGRLLIPKSAEELSRMYRGTDWRTTPGDPHYMTKTTGTTLLLVPTPQKTKFDSVGLRVTLAPSRAANGINTDIYEKFIEVIARGARARLYATPGQPYYDMNLSMAYRRDFMIGIGEAKIKANKGISRASVAIEFQPF